MIDVDKNKKVTINLWNGKSLVEGKDGCYHIHDFGKDTNVKIDCYSVDSVIGKFHNAIIDHNEMVDELTRLVETTLETNEKILY